MSVFLGIDVGKAEFHCALVVDGKLRNKKFLNSKAGFEQLYAWFRDRKVEKVHACLEATGGWSEDLGIDLIEHGHDVSIVNPLSIKSYGQCKNVRTKTDKADAALIAEYCAKMNPPLWTPPSPPQRRLRQLARRRMALDDMRTQEKNRLQGPGIEAIAESIETTLAFLDRQVVAIDEEMLQAIDDDPTLRGRRDLLESIPGVGKRLSATLLGELPQITEFRSAKKLAAFVGLCPQLSQSGTSVNHSRLSRRGNAYVRKILYMPAVVAMRFNPVIRALAERMETRGKHGKQIVAAAMRRLLSIAYGVLKSGKPFDPAYSRL